MKSEYPWYVYIVQCQDESLYTGCTPNLQQRLIAHNAGKGAKYTRSRRPVRLLYSEKLASRSLACKREAHIKQLTRAQKQLFIAAQSSS